MKKIILLLAALFSFQAVQNTALNAQELKISPQTQECLDCHNSVTPGIVMDWKKSNHSKTTLTEAIKKSELERRVSAADISKINSAGFAVGCFECHSLNKSSHKDNFEHFGSEINVVVSPNDCKTCHPVEADQYAVSKKAAAHFNLSENPVYNLLSETITSNKDYEKGKIIHGARNETALGETCYACHGTVVSVEGKTTVKSSLGDIEVPKLTNWPNQGTGRVNPDGSFGACTACHPRHSFSIETARKPYTCGQCHLEPDVPAYNVYKESKHGNIYESKEEGFNFSSVPWVIGKDFTAPTCATCHNSLLVNPEGIKTAERTHNFGDRLWVRIFGLVYSHPQPKSGKTYEIKNDDGLPLPTTFTGKPASAFLIDTGEMNLRKEKMTSVCTSCHSTSWTNAQFGKLERVNADADKMVLSSTKILLDGWTAGTADKKNPFDEELEFMWQNQWLFYANSVRYAAAMMGPDYAAFKNGWYEMTKNLEQMRNFNKINFKK